MTFVCTIALLIFMMDDSHEILLTFSVQLPHHSDDYLGLTVDRFTAIPVSL